MRVFGAIGLLMVMGCSGPSPHFRDVPGVVVQVDQARFLVRSKDNLAEAVRLNPQYAPRFSGLTAQAERAIAVATECRVLTIRGDAALILAEIDCGLG